MNPRVNDIEIGANSKLSISIRCNVDNVNASNEEPQSYPRPTTSPSETDKAQTHLVVSPSSPFPEFQDSDTLARIVSEAEHKPELSTAALQAIFKYAPRTNAAPGGRVKNCVEDNDGEPGAKTHIPIRTPRPSENMGLAYNVYLNSNKIYGCKNCKTHLSNHDDIVSRNFRGQHGKAYLFDSVVNIIQGDAGERNMTTGRHIVRDIMCKQCNETVGWKYDKAYEQAEKYKEGKYILEAELLCQVT